MDSLLCYYSLCGSRLYEEPSLRYPAASCSSSKSGLSPPRLNTTPSAEWPGRNFDTGSCGSATAARTCIIYVHPEVLSSSGSSPFNRQLNCRLNGAGYHPAPRQLPIAMQPAAHCHCIHHTLNGHHICCVSHVGLFLFCSTQYILEGGCHFVIQTL